MSLDFTPKFEESRNRWVITYHLPGRGRVRKTRKTEEAALELAEDLREKYRRSGADGLDFDPAVWGRVCVLVDEMGGLEALEGLVRRHKASEDAPVVFSPPLAAAIEAHLHRLDGKLAPEHWKNKRRNLRRFAAANVGKACHEVTPERIEKFLPKVSENLSTQWNHFRDVRALFNDLRKRKVLRDSPAESVRPPKKPNQEPELLTLEDARKVFEVLERPGWSDLAAYVALRAFTGLRSKHLLRVRWEMVKPERRAIDLPAGVLRKTGKRSWLTGYPENLWLWLETYAPAEGPLASSQWIEHRHSSLMQFCGIKYPRNGWRHSFASYHLAAHQNAELTRRLMTHREASRVLEDVYEGYATPEEGEAWEKILPRWVNGGWG